MGSSEPLLNALHISLARCWKLLFQLLQAQAIQFLMEGYFCCDFEDCPVFLKLQTWPKYKNIKVLWHYVRTHHSVVTIWNLGNWTQVRRGWERGKHMRNVGKNCNQPRVGFNFTTVWLNQLSALEQQTSSQQQARRRDVEKELLGDFIYYLTLNRNLLWLWPSALSWYLVVVVARSEEEGALWVYAIPLANQ